MAEQWIPASVALSIVDPSPLRQSGRFTLAERAYAGLVKARAKLLLINKERRENVLLPPDFWWAGGNAALEQNWSCGDFSTWIKQSVHWQAFGVSFALSGVLEILPVEKRAQTAQSLSVVGMDGWITAQEARRFAYGKAGLNPHFAGRAIIDACQLGYVTARAVLMQRQDGEREESRTISEREWDIPEWFWDHFTGDSSSAQDWERGVFSGKGQGPNGYCSVSLKGVYFLASTLTVLLPRDAKPDKTQSQPQTKGGRPAGYDWADATNAIWAMIYSNEQKPKVQADIERAMINHLKKGDEEPGESTVRPFAKRIWDKFKED